MENNQLASGASVNEPGGRFKKHFNKFYYNIIPVIAALLSGNALVLYLNLNTTSAFSMVFLLLLYPVFRKSLRIKKPKLKVTAYILGLFYSGAMTLVRLEDALEKEFPAIWLCVVFVGFFLMFSAIVSCAYNRLLKTDFRMKDMTRRNVTGGRIALVFVGSMVIMLLGWLPYFLDRFPGDVTYDSNWQLLQATGAVSLSNHHPIACTMMIKLFYNLGLALFNGNQTLAVATYSVIQAILLSASFAYLISTLYRFKVRLPVIAAILAFYTLVPYNAIYSVTMWKDIWFGGIVVVLCTTVYRFIRFYDDGSGRQPIFELIMFFIFGVGMCLFRSNGLYAFILFVPFAIITFFKKNPAVPILAVLVIPLVLIIKGPIYNSMNVEPPDTIEALSIPAQHIARAIKDGAELTDEQYELLSNVVNVKRIPKVYKPHISDPVKDLVRATNNQEYIEKHKSEFLKLWIDLGKENPKSYLLAQIDQTYGYWYPDVQYWVCATRMNTGGFEFEKDMKVSENIDKVLTNITESYKKIPYYGLVWSIGMATWISLFSFGLCFVKKKLSYCTVYIPIIGILATLMIATPVYAEFRYAYSVFTTLPLLFVIPHIGGSMAQKKRAHGADEPEAAAEAADGILGAEMSESGKPETAAAEKGKSDIADPEIKEDAAEHSGSAEITGSTEPVGSAEPADSADLTDSPKAADTEQNGEGSNGNEKTE